MASTALTKEEDIVKNTSWHDTLAIQEQLYLAIACEIDHFAICRFSILQSQW